MTVDYDTNSPRMDITSFFFWFRAITISLVVVFDFTGVKAVPITSLIFAVLYNALILIFKRQIVEKLRAHPTMILADLLVGFLLLASSGGFKSPYFLYCFSPLILGSFIFGYRGAFLLAGMQVFLYSVAVKMNGYRLLFIDKTVDSIITDCFFFVLVSTSVAYLADLIHKFESVNEGKAVAESSLEESKRRLESSLKLTNLSERETQVIMLTTDGKTADRVAQELGISINTVQTYLSRAYRKLGVLSKQEAILKAIDNEQRYT